MKRIGCIGFGKMGILHSGIINAFQDASIVSVAETSGFVRGYANKIMKNSNFYKDYKEMLKNEELDGAIICTPVGSHAEVMNYLYGSNLSMFVEKPLCRRLDELNFTINGLLHKNISLVTGYCLLFKDTFVKAKEILENEVIGKVLWAKGFVNVQQIFKRSNHWQYDKKIAGGGVMINLASHLISVLVDLFGQEKEVLALNRIHYSRDVEDVGLALIHFENEIICSIESSWSKYNCRLPKVTIEINGEYGQIFVDETEMKVFLSEDRKGLKSGWTRLTQADLFEGVEFDVGGAEFTNQDRFFIDSLDGKNTNWTKNLDVSMTTQRIVEKIYGKN